MNTEIAADLHIHTTGSDGTDSFDNRLKQARERGLNSIAITDHDMIINQLDAGSANYEDLTVVTGVEIRADLFNTKIELLGYFVDPDNNRLKNVLQEARQHRMKRNRKLVAQLNEIANLNIEYDDLQASIQGEIGRPHLAKILVEQGCANSISEAFSDYLAEGGDCFVPMKRIPCKEVIEAIQTAGGIASLAHPGRIRSDCIPTIISEAIDYGLDAIETWYPYQDTAFGVLDADKLARKHGILRTGGSDCHGQRSGKFRIGNTGMPSSAFKSLQKARR